MAIVVLKQPLIEPWLYKNDPVYIDIDDPRIRRSHIETMMLKLGQIITSTDIKLIDLSAGRVAALARRYEKQLGCLVEAKEIKLALTDLSGEYEGGGIRFTWGRIRLDPYRQNYTLMISFKKVDGT